MSIYVLSTARYAGEINDLERTASDRGLPAVRRVGAASVPAGWSTSAPGPA